MYTKPKLYILFQLWFWFLGFVLTQFAFASPLLIQRSANKKALTKSDSNETFLKVVPSKTSVYKGESFKISYLLYSQHKAMIPDADENIEFTNCFSEEMIAKEKTWVEKINGKNYNVLTLKQYIVIPYQSGLLNFPKFNIKLKISKPPKIDDFFQQDVIISKNIVSENSSIMVKALPLLPKGMSFSNIVGVFKIRSNYIKKSNNLSLNIKLSGFGNLKYLNLDFSDLPNGIESYDIKQFEKYSLTKNGMFAEYNFLCDFVSKYRGNYKIPEKKICYFDPDQQKYKLLSLPHYNWVVDIGPELPLVNNASSKQQLQRLIIKGTLSDTFFGTLFFSSNIYYTTLILSALFVVTGSFYASIHKNKQINPELYISKSAYKVAIKSLKELKSVQLSTSDLYEKRVQEIFNIYLCSKLTISYQDFSWRLIQQKLNSRNIPIDFVHSILELILTHNEIRFSENLKYDQNHDKNIQHLLRTIKKLEDILC
jgi:hypothetical protein